MWIVLSGRRRRRSYRLSNLQRAPRRKAQGAEGNPLPGTSDAASLIVATAGALPYPLELLPALQRVNRTFAFDQGDERNSSRHLYVTSGRQRLTVLSGHPLSPAEQSSQCAPRSALLKFMIEDPVQVTALFGSGILIRAPRPERYAIHKLLCTTKRLAGEAAAQADVRRASELLKGCAQAGRWPELKAAFAEAIGQGRAWSDALEAGALRLHRGAIPIALWCLKQARHELAHQSRWGDREPDQSRQRPRSICPSSCARPQTLHSVGQDNCKSL